MKNLLLASLVLSTAMTASASEILRCKVYNGNADIKNPLTIDLKLGEKAKELTLGSEIGSIGEFTATFKFFKFEPDLGGDYRLTITSSAVGEPTLKAISWIDSLTPNFNGRTWLFDKTSIDLKFTYVDYYCALKQ